MIMGDFIASLNSNTHPKNQLSKLQILIIQREWAFVLCKSCISSHCWFVACGKKIVVLFVIKCFNVKFPF